MTRIKKLKNVGLVTATNYPTENINIENCYGFDNLFYLITYAICGQLQSAYVPNTIVLYKVNPQSENPTNWEEFASNENNQVMKVGNTVYVTALTPVKNYPETSNFDSIRDKYSVSFSATIPYSLAIQSLIPTINQNKYLIVLFGKNNKGLAYFELDPNLLVQLTEGAQLLINWFLYFENFNETGENK